MTCIFCSFQEIKKNWFKKAADEADLILSSESEDENFANSAQKSANSKSAIQVNFILQNRIVILYLSFKS